MRNEDWLSQGLDHIWLPYSQMKTANAPLAVRATRGSRIILADGRELIDGVSSWWTAVHGYNHPHIVEAVTRQAETLPHVMMGGLANDQAYRLASRLADLSPGDLNRVFFAESGSVSVEIAMKVAIQYWINRGDRGRTKFVSFKGGYHGDTFAAMSVCDPEDGMHAQFGAALLPQHVVELPDTESGANELERVLSENSDIAGVIVEPLIQGAGGMRMHSHETLAKIAEFARRYGALLIFDEIFSGLGRTGAMFASEKAGVTPDIMTVSKSLTGGVLPLAATVASEAVFEAFYSDDPNTSLMHGPTFMGNALSCAAANASLDLFEREPRLDQVRRLETLLGAALAPAKALPFVRDVRVMGAVGAVEVEEMRDIEGLKARFVEAGVFIRPVGNVAYLAPAYTISEAELTQLASSMLTVLTDWFAD